MKNFKIITINFKILRIINKMLVEFLIFHYLLCLTISKSNKINLFLRKIQTIRLIFLISKIHSLKKMEIQISRIKNKILNFQKIQLFRIKMIKKTICFHKMQVFCNKTFQMLQVYFIKIINSQILITQTKIKKE